MRNILKGKIVIFGAGKIGRSFIGQLFSTGGYEVVFVDVYKPVIDELNKRKSYRVCIKAEHESVIEVTNVRGIFSDESNKVKLEVATADLVCVSVGLNGLAGVFPLLTEGLKERFSIDNQWALDIIIAENIRNADVYFRNEMFRYLPKEYPFDNLVGLVETSIGKMVPIMLEKETGKDILLVYAEPYNTLILAKNSFKNSIPQINGIAPKENMKAWVDRKLFIHNLGHAAAAYIGYLYNPGFVYVYEALSEPIVFELVRGAMVQSANVLLRKYPNEFTEQNLNDHINDLLVRFQNKALGDTIFRVGCDLFRKLGPQDRLVGAIKSAQNMNLPYSKILFTLVCGFSFKATNENESQFRPDMEFHELYKKDNSAVLSVVCGFNPKFDAQIYDEIYTIEKQIGNNPLAAIVKI